MIQTVNETVKRVVGLPDEPEAREKKLASLRSVGTAALNIVFLLSSVGILAITDRSVVLYLLTAVVLASWFLLGSVRS